MKYQNRSRKNCTVGIISDTHGLIRPEAITALQGADLIIHAGDIGGMHVIDELERISPVVAVRGNMDTDSWAYALKRNEVIEMCGHILYVLHDMGRLDLDPASAHIGAVIHGHSHRPALDEHNGVLYMNPGSAGPRRFTLPVTVAKLTINGRKMSAEIITLRV